MEVEFGRNADRRIIGLSCRWFEALNPAAILGLPAVQAEATIRHRLVDSVNFIELDLPYTSSAIRLRTRCAVRTSPMPKQPASYTRRRLHDSAQIGRVPDRFVCRRVPFAHLD